MAFDNLIKHDIKQRLEDRIWGFEQTVETLHHEDTSDQSIVEQLEEDIEILQDLLKKLKGAL
jgi:response regulator of citrate/malate metabolism